MQGVERSLDLGDVDAGAEAVRRDLLRWRDDRLGAALVHAPQDEPEQLPQVATALLRAGCIGQRSIASVKRGKRLVDHPVLRAGQYG
jgi:hypothetical protein